MGLDVKLHGNNLEPPMSALGQDGTWQRILLMSALPPKADIGTQSWNVRFVPKADIMRRSKSGLLFDHLVGAGEQRSRNRKAKRLRGF